MKMLSVVREKDSRTMSQNEIESKFKFVFNFQFCVTIQSIYIGVMNGNVKKR